MTIANTLLQKRSPLPSGHTLFLGGTTYEILGVVGAGSSTIVYEAKYQDSLNKNSVHYLYIKELYPLVEEDLLWRNPDGSLQWNPELNDFMEDRRYFFKKGNEINISLLKDDPSSISGNMNSYEAFGTYYTLLPIHGGRMLEDIMADSMSSEKLEFMELKHIVHIFREILTSIRKFHDNQMLIMDISPDNILILPHQAMFIDYNSTWDIDDEEGDYIFSQKEGYTPPEIIFCDVDEIGPWSDLYSACAILYEMICHKKFKAAEINHLLQTIQQSPLLLGQSREVYERLLNIFRKGLSPITRKRYQTCEQFIWDIDVLLDVIDKEDSEAGIALKKNKEQNSEQDIKYSEQNNKGSNQDNNNEQTNKNDDKQDYENKKQNHAQKYGFTIIISCAVIAILLCIFAFGKTFHGDKETTAILYQGNSSSNLLNRGRLCMVEDQYLYYVDGSGNLHISDYDAQTESFTYDKNKIAFSCDNEIEDDSVAFLNVGKDIEGNDDRIFFLYAGGSGHGDSLMVMNLDGSNQKTLATFGDNQQGDQFTYVRFNDGQEFIYYLMADIPENEDDLRKYDLCRLDLDTMETQTLMTSCVEWFNVYDSSLYYIDYDYDNNLPVLKKASLEGENPTVLDNTREFWDGFIEDNTMFMFSLSDDNVTLILCDLDGNIKGDMDHPYSKTFDTADFDYVYYDGWIYYSDYDKNELRRFNVNMTSDQVVCENVDSYGMSCYGPYLFLYDGEENQSGDIAAKDVLLRDKAVTDVKMYHLPE